ncbi:MAG: hypothetical protein V4734_08920 [Terriglobus sp.]
MILRNGTFVSLSPGLAQRLPLEMSKSAQVQVAGDEFTYSRTKTIQARTITIAGVSYTDDAPRVGPDGAGPVGPVDGPPPPPREVGGPRSGPRPPRPCDAPPPPPAGTGPADGQPAMTPGVPPPPPPSGGAPSPKPQGL